MIKFSIKDDEFKNYKEEFSEIDLQLFGYDNIFSLITLSNSNYGFIEVFKEADFILIVCHYLVSLCNV